MLFSRLSKTKSFFAGGLASIFSSGSKLDDNDLDEIEDHLLMTDIGVDAANKIIVRTRNQKVGTIEEFIKLLRETLLEVLEPCDRQLTIEQEDRPFVILMIGVNGVGKTTTVAKISNFFRIKGKRVTVAACDTFRAAAIEQLQSWGQRLKIDVIAQQHGADRRRGT